MQTKKEIRTQAKEKRAQIPADVKKKCDTAIWKNLTAHPLFLKAEELFCFVSFQDEVDTRRFLQECILQGKRVAVPKVLGSRKMEFYYIDDMSSLVPGTLGILEPKGDTPPAAGDNVLVIMPGLAFDLQGNRVGYGGGFYDVYLRAHPDYRRIAVAYECQRIDAIPADEQDVRPEYLITEKGCYPCQSVYQKIQ